MRIIAEIGVNHDGSEARAIELVEACARAGADAAKFQIFSTDALVTRDAGRAAYQADALGAGSQADMLRRLELGPDAFRRIADACGTCGIEFLATPFDPHSARFLIDDLGARTVKVGSGDLDNLPLLIALAMRGVAMIVSTGMSSLGEIEDAVDAVAWGRLMHERGERATDRFPPRDERRAARGALRGSLADTLTLLHCTSEYPAAHDTLNMTMIPTLGAAFRLPVGFSDHSTDDTAAIMAVCMGATVIERHVTHDRAAEGPDHAASLDPAGLARMVAAVRDAVAALGSGRKVMSGGEAGVRAVARKRVLAARPIRRGETIALADVALKRAASGPAARELEHLIGRPAARDLAPDEPVAV